jgi:hypothetical protein
MRKTYDFLSEGKISACRGVRDETATRKTWGRIIQFFTMLLQQGIVTTKLFDLVVDDL